MSRETVTLHYDGPALADHQMDVAYLAPALYALNDLCKVANKMANGDRASVRVFANVDREQNSFVFDIEIAMSFIEQARALLNNPRVQDVKEIAEWIGLIKGGAVATTVGLLDYLSCCVAVLQSLRRQKTGTDATCLWLERKVTITT